MRLVLENGYPYPLPSDFDSDGYDARSHEVVIHSVARIEWLHTLTVEFAHLDAFEAARQRSRCWKRWSHLVLEAIVSSADGYEHPAIVFDGKAYCGFVLMQD